MIAIIGPSYYSMHINVIANGKQSEKHRIHTITMDECGKKSKYVMSPIRSRSSKHVKVMDRYLSVS